MWNSAAAAVQRLPENGGWCSRLLTGVALGVVLVLGVSVAHAQERHYGSWSGDIGGVGPGYTIEVTHPDEEPFAGLYEVIATNTGTAPWGDFHFFIFDPIGGQDISNIHFLDAGMGGSDPTSSQSGLTWVIDNVTVGAQITLHFCSDPVLPGETANFVVYTDNPDHISFFGVAFYPTPVPPSGACCHPDGTCTLTCLYDCAAPSVWQGEGTGCDPNPCPQPTGACCYPDGSCAVTLLVDCTGVWTMFGDCDPNECPQPDGACCLPDYTCEIRKQADCPYLWIVFGVCDPNPCPPAPQGACCYPNGSCVITTEAGCVAPNVWQGPDTVCVPNPCPQPDLAVCCIAGWVNGHQGHCVITSQADCMPPNIWHPEWLSCDPNPCPVVPTEDRTWGQIKSIYR